jgi:hypothetical protein
VVLDRTVLDQVVLDRAVLDQAVLDLAGFRSMRSVSSCNTRRLTLSPDGLFPGHRALARFAKADLVSRVVRAAGADR